MNNIMNKINIYITYSVKQKIYKIIMKVTFHIKIVWIYNFTKNKQIIYNLVLCKCNNNNSNNNNNKFIKLL